MSRNSHIIRNFVAALLLLVALVLSFVLLVGKQQEQRCTKLIVEVQDSAVLRFVDRSMVIGWLDSAGIKTIGRPLASIDKLAIDRMILAHPYVSGVNVKSSMRGELYIRVWQLRPAVRVLTENGYNFYADTLGNVIPPAVNYALDVPLVTGNIRFSFATDFFGLLDQKNQSNDVQYLKKLINFVNIIECDKFLSHLVTQIYVSPNLEVELTTVNAGQTIVFGTIDDGEEKLHKICDFFAQAPRDVAMGVSCRIVVKYKDQIILVKNQGTEIDSLTTR
ncbi:MAG: hypothetical protein RR980_03005 [Mucinivorans sp.]